MKKIQKKARQETNKSCSETESLGESSLENENGSTKIKDENESKYTFPITYEIITKVITGSLASYHLLKGDTESFINGSIESDQKLVVKEEQENDDECFKKALNLCTSLQNYKGN